MFYKTGVDIASTKSMWNFLKNHFQYSTLNSWNGLTSIAHNVKLYNLKLDGDWGQVLDYLFDEADCGALQIAINDELQNFASEHPGYTVGFNGRSGGYLVLYNAHDYQSVLPSCVEQYETYDDFKSDLKNSYSYWGGERVYDYLSELRQAVELVRDFDRLCDSLRDLVNSFSMKNFKSDRLAAAVEEFNYFYGDELETLGLVGPEMEDGKIKLNDIASYNLARTALLDCLQSVKDRISFNEDYLWLRDY